MRHLTTKIALPALILGAAGLLSGCSAAAGDSARDVQSTPPSTTADGLLGEWQMTSLEVGTPGDLQPIPYEGQVIFTAERTMAVQAANPDTSAPDTAYTVNGYEAFYGEMTVDDNSDSLSVTVESALARDLLGTTLSRHFEVDGNTLVLTPTDPSEGFRATYERQDR